VAQPADLRHIVPHDLVAPLGHHRGLFQAPDRAAADTEKPDPEWISHGSHLAQVVANFVAGLVNVLQRRAGQFKLTAWLQADAGPVTLQADQVLAFMYALPAKLVAQAFKHGAHTHLATVVQRAQPVLHEAELLMLGADAPLTARLAPRFHPLDKLGL